jgi:ATP-dependent DNA ligase
VPILTVPRRLDSTPRRDALKNGVMRPRTLPTGFVPPCLPTEAKQPPSGEQWLHEIKHDGYRLMARRDPVGIRLLSRNGKFAMYNQEA